MVVVTPMMTDPLTIIDKMFSCRQICESMELKDMFHLYRTISN